MYKYGTHWKQQWKTIGSLLNSWEDCLWNLLWTGWQSSKSFWKTAKDYQRRPVKNYEYWKYEVVNIQIILGGCGMGRKVKPDISTNNAIKLFRLFYYWWGCGSWGDPWPCHGRRSLITLSSNLWPQKQTRSLWEDLLVRPLGGNGFGGGRSSKSTRFLSMERWKRMPDWNQS